MAADGRAFPSLCVSLSPSSLSFLCLSVLVGNLLGLQGKVQQ